MHLRHFILVPEWKNYFHHVYFEFVPNFTPERIQSQRGRGGGVERDGGGQEGGMNMLVYGRKYCFWMR